MIDSMMQEGTDAALDDQVSRPRITPPAGPSFSLFGLGLGVPQGVGAGIAKSIAFGAEMTGAFGQVAGSTGTDSAGGMFSTQSAQERKQSEEARQKLIQDGPDFSNEAGDAFRQRAADILPDPKTTHTSQQVVAGLFDFGTRAIGYGFALGPLAPAVMTGDAGLEEADRLKQQGVDKGTRTKAGAVAGAIAGVSIAVPMTGPTRLVQAAKGVAVGEAGIVGQAAAEKAILHAAGYDKIADTFDPFDPVALGVGAVPGLFGLAMKPPARLKPLRTEADVRAAAKLSPEEAAHEAAFESSPENLRMLEDAIQAEKRPEIRAELQAELGKQQAAASEHAVRQAVQADPDMVAAARVGQVVDAVDAARLTPDLDLAGRDAHLSAVEMAHEQMARGEHVDVEYIVAPAMERPPIEVTEHNGWMSATVDGGLVGGHVRDGALHISSSELAPDMRGAGIGTAMYRALVDEAHARGLRVFSDSTVSGDAVRVYDSLKRRGYDVQRTPGGGEMMSPTGVPEGAFGAGAVSPAFEVRAKQRGPESTAAAFEELRAARTPPEPKAPRAAAPKQEPAATGKKATEPAKAEPTAQPSAGPKAAPSGQGDVQAPASVARAAAEAQALNPDMLVQLEGMDAPMKVGELLAKIQDEAKQDTLMGKLLEVAAECDLRA